GRGDQSVHYPSAPGLVVCARAVSAGALYACPRSTATPVCLYPVWRRPTDVYWPSVRPHGNASRPGDSGPSLHPAGGARPPCRARPGGDASPPRWSMDDRPPPRWHVTVVCVAGGQRGTRVKAQHPTFKESLRSVPSKWHIPPNVVVVAPR